MKIAVFVLLSLSFSLAGDPSSASSPTEISFPTPHATSNSTSISTADTTSTSPSIPTSIPTLSSNASAPAPECTTCGVSNSTDPELDLVARRRRADLGRWAPPAMMAMVPAWLAAQRPDGTWPDVDYRTGCAAQRANWPIQEHWNRVIALAGAWAGLSPWDPGVDGGAALAAARRGMAWWFERDYTNPACIGGTPNDACPCGTPGLWNTNWFGQVILIPQLVSTACILLQPALTVEESAGCVRIPRRGWDLRDAFIPGLNGRLTGANTLSVMQNSASLAVFTHNAGMLADALARAMRECAFSDTPKADGIHRDGAFLQHDGILYAGNYGKDLLNAFVALEGEVTGTKFAADNTTRAAVAQMLRAVEWMVFRDKSNGRLKWDYNTVGRFIAFPTTDLQASADININTTLLAAAVADFSGVADISATVARLQANLTSPLDGNRAFPAADYMVHRRGWTLANKMISTRSVNNELTNGANPFGYMTGQGTLFTYVTGNEYTDIQAQWDWRLIPGTTTVLAPLPKQVGVNGTREFVGVVSDGEVGLSAMQYASAADGLAFNKAWFFLGDAVLVTTSNITSTNATPVVSVLDNRAAAPGGIQLDGKVYSGNGTTTARTLLYGGNGYLSHGPPFALTLQEEERTGNWSAISTSKLGVQRARVFSAYTAIPSTAYSYTVLPAISARNLAREAQRPSIVPLSGSMGAATRAVLALAFFPGSLEASVCAAGWDMTVSVSAPALVLVTRKRRGYAVTVADPTQRLKSVEVTLSGRCGEKRGKRAKRELEAEAEAEAEPESASETESDGSTEIKTPNTKSHGRCCRTTLHFTLPSGGHAGSSVTLPACR